jgi:hypothetical protein
MSRHQLYRALARLVVAWGALTWIAVSIGPGLIMLTHSPVEYTVEALMPGFVTSISATAKNEGNGDIAISVHAFRSIPIAGDYVIAPWIPMVESIDAGHDLVPVVILLSVLAAWPHRRFRNGLWAFCWGALTSSILLVWTVSVHFAGLFEINLQRVASFYHEPRSTPLFLTQFIFFESGGVWLVALLLASSIAAFGNRKEGAVVPRT